MGNRPPSPASRKAASSSADLLSAASIEALAFERLTATQVAEPFGIDRLEASLGEQALRHEGQRFDFIVALVAHPCCGRRSWENRRCDPRCRVDAAPRPEVGGAGQRGRPFGQAPTGQVADSVQRGPQQVRTDQTDAGRRSRARPARTPLVTAPKWSPATAASRLAVALAFRPRSALISTPTSMPTGHAVAHSPQPAQVSIPWKPYSACMVSSCTPLALALETCDLAPTDDTLARRQRQLVRRTFGFAKAALDALVDDRIARGQRLQVFEMRVAIVVDDHARIQETLGSKSSLIARMIR